MHRNCRICGTTTDLKYTRKELRKINKDLTKVQFLKNHNLPTVKGNICHECDKRVINFNDSQKPDEEADDVDSDIYVDDDDEVINNCNIVKNAASPNSSPIIVDQSPLLFDIFLQKVSNGVSSKSQAQRNYEKPPSLSTNQQTNYLKAADTNHLLDSEGDTEVIEVFTSRESTPASVQHNQHVATACADGPPILGTIDLLSDNDDELQGDPKNTGTQIAVVAAATQKNDTAVEEAQTSVEQNCISTTSPRKRRRKTYNEKDLRVLGSFSLISSDDDSEAELPPLTHLTPPSRPISSSPSKSITPNNSQPTTPKTTKTADNILSSKTQDDSKPTNIIINSSTDQVTVSVINSEPEISTSTSLNRCLRCFICLPDAESLQVHQRIHEGIPCQLCTQCFPTNLRLVSHMRRKHTQCTRDDILCERPRIAQDSAITIRLRFLDQYNYYECQICGLVDEAYKEHITHIMERHASESKSLRDPMMKELNCMVCKKKFDLKYLDLCEHLLHEHTEKQYLKQLQQVTDERYEEYNARIFKFKKFQKTFFLQCAVCKQVIAGFKNFRKHTNEHSTAVDIKEQQKQQSNEKTKTKPKSVPQTINTNLDKGKCITSSTTVGKSKQQVQHNITANKKQPMDTAKTNVDENIFKVPKNKKSNTAKNESKKSMQNIKSKEGGYVIRLKTNKSISEKGDLENNNKAKKRRINRKLMLVSKIVKVKPPLRQFATQKYQCKYCQHIFDGFCNLNLHLLFEHFEDEFIESENCQCVLPRQPATLYDQHQKKLHSSADSIKIRRKYSQPFDNASTSMVTSSHINGGNNELENSIVTSVDVDENYNKDCKRLRLDGNIIKQPQNVMNTNHNGKDITENRDENAHNGFKVVKDFKTNVNFETGKLKDKDSIICFYCGDLTLITEIKEHLDGAHQHKLIKSENNSFIKKNVI